MSVAYLVKKNGGLTFYQVAREAAAELTPRRGVLHVLRVNAYYRERNALATFCHRRTKRKQIAKREIDLQTIRRCKWI